MRSQALLAATLCIGLNAFASCSGTEKKAAAPTPIRPRAETPLPTPKFDIAAVGEKIFLENCAKCHKSDGSGGTAIIDGRTIDAKDLRSAETHAKTEAELIRFLMEGSPENGMPAFRGKLSETELRAVARKIRETFTSAPE